jgi:hypothetical protein
MNPRKLKIGMQVKANNSPDSQVFTVREFDKGMVALEYQMASGETAWGGLIDCGCIEPFEAAALPQTQCGEVWEEDEPRYNDHD